MKLICDEVKKIKEEYKYDFSSLLIRENDTPEIVKNKNEEIEDIATYLLKNILKKDKIIEPIKGNRFATPIIGISQHFGFLILKGNFNKLLGENIQYKDASGAIIVNGDLKGKFETDKLIILNPKETGNYRRITVAHELGHYLFDFNETTDYQYEHFFENDKKSSNPIDERAKRFANAILMPKNKFKQRYDELYKKKFTYFELVGQLSQDFIVPTILIDKRIKELNIKDLL